MPSVSTNSEVALLLERVAPILETGRGHGQRTINQETVLAYWLIRREIVHALQGGEARTQYGNAMITELLKRLAERYCTGFSTVNLNNSRRFCLAYADRSVSISHLSGGELVASNGSGPIGYPQRGDKQYRAQKTCVPHRANRWTSTASRGRAGNHLCKFLKANSHD